ncbi:MAG: ribosome maturation factor RimM [Moorellales bacterium]
MARRRPLPGFVSVGRVTGPHGWKGAVRVEPLTDFPERFREVASLYLVRGENRRELTVQEVKGQGTTIIIKFAEVNTLEEAQELRGAQLEVPRKAVHTLPEGYFYVYELVDLPVYSQQGEFLGYLEEVIRTGSNDVYVVRHPETHRELLLPATREVVKAVDLDREEIRVQLLPGLGE